MEKKLLLPELPFRPILTRLAASNISYTKATGRILDSYLKHIKDSMRTKTIRKICNIINNTFANKEGLMS
jgi:hypothetical protein